MPEPRPSQLMFGPVRRQPRLVDTVADTILQKILDRRLRPGDALPSERELREQLGVSRPVIREALQSLGAHGVIEMRRSASAVVTAVDPSVVSASMSLYLQTTALYADPQVQEVRLMLEPAIAELAARRATDDDIASLRTTYKRVGEAVEAFRASPCAAGSPAVEAVLVADLEFHLAVARATHNDIYLIMLEATRDAQMVTRHVSVARSGQLVWEVERCATDLLVVLEAIMAHDADRARDSMLEHLVEQPSTPAGSGGAGLAPTRAHREGRAHARPNRADAQDSGPPDCV